MSRYDDPELLRKFRESMGIRTFSRYPPRSVEDDQPQALEDSRSSLEIPESMIRGTHDLREAFDHDDSNDGLSMNTAHEQPCPGRNGANSEFPQMSHRLSLASSQDSGVAAPPCTPETYPEEDMVGEGSAGDPSEIRITNILSRILTSGIDASIHAPPHQFTPLEIISGNANGEDPASSSRKGSSVSTSYEVIPPRSPHESLTSLGQGDDDVDASNVQKTAQTHSPAPGPDGFESVHSASSPGNETPNQGQLEYLKPDFKPDFEAFLDASWSFGAYYKSKPKQQPKTILEEPSGFRGEELEKYNFNPYVVEDNTVDDRKQEVIEGAARAGCLKKSIALALKISNRAYPPGQGISTSVVVPICQVKGTDEKPVQLDEDNAVAVIDGSLDEVKSKLTISPSKGSSSSKETVKRITTAPEVMKSTPVVNGLHVTPPEMPAPIEKVMYKGKTIERTQEKTPWQSRQLKEDSARTKTGEGNDDFFSSWPTVEGTERPTAKVRRVKITNLPVDATPKLVASLLYGGKIQSIQIRGSVAEALFIDPDACQQFCDDNSNGLVYGHADGKERFVLVDPAKEADVLSGRIRELIDKGGSRCVRAVGTDFSMKVEDLQNDENVKKLKIEHVVEDQTRPGVRTLTFRFCEITHAGSFKAFLDRHEDWEAFNVFFCKDPCERRRGEKYED